MDCVSSHNPKRVEPIDVLTVEIIPFNPFRIGRYAVYGKPRALPRVNSVCPLAGTKIIFSCQVTFKI